MLNRSIRHHDGTGSLMVLLSGFKVVDNMNGIFNLPYQTQKLEDQRDSIVW